MRKGWFNQSYRHSLASKGISTSPRRSFAWTKEEILAKYPDINKASLKILDQTPEERAEKIKESEDYYASISPEAKERIKENLVALAEAEHKEPSSEDIEIDLNPPKEKPSIRVDLGLDDIMPERDVALREKEEGLDLKETLAKREEEAEMREEFKKTPMMVSGEGLTEEEKSVLPKYGRIVLPEQRVSGTRDPGRNEFSNLRDMLNKTLRKKPSVGYVSLQRPVEVE